MPGTDAERGIAEDDDDDEEEGGRVGREEAWFMLSSGDRIVAACTLDGSARYSYVTPPRLCGCGLLKPTSRRAVVGRCIGNASCSDRGAPRAARPRASPRSCRRASNATRRSLGRQGSTLWGNPR